MILKALSINNFRCFEKMEIEFNENCTVLVGMNGSGKSTILEAAAISVGTLIAAMDVANYSLKSDDAHFKYYDMGSVIDVQPQYPVSIRAIGNIDNNEVNWERSLNKPTGRGSLANAKNLTSIAASYQERLRNGDAALILPLVAYYGTGRLWAQHREKKNDVFAKNTRVNGYIDSLNGAANNKLMMKWFQKMTIQQYQRNKSISEYMAVCRAVEKCFSFITGFNDVNVQYNLDTDDLDLIYTSQNKKVRIPLSKLSDGYKCTISLIADIAYRMALLNPQLNENVLERTNGIVLIDEIDLHLHPEWQKRIISDLRNIFPKIQFIVSTHAPSVINSVKSENLILLENEQARVPVGEVYGKDTNTIIKGIMNSYERPIEVKNLFEKFYACIDNNDIAMAKVVLHELESLIGEDDSELVGCNVKLRLTSMRVKKNDQN